MRISRLLLLGLTILLPASILAATARAENIGELLVSQSLVERHGLTRSWFAQLPLAGMRAKVVAVVPDDDLLLVTTTTANVLALDAETGRLVWSAQVGDPNQPTLAPAGNGSPAFRNAHWKSLTKAKAGVAEPAADAGAAPKSAAATPPAEGGSPANDSWGYPTPGTAAPMASNLVVAVINGTTLYLLDRADGRPHIDGKSKQVWKTELRNLPKNAALVTEDLVYVPTANGHIETYAINDLGAGVTYVTSSGRNEYPPVVSGQRVAWISDQGVVHITLPDAITPKYEIDLGGPSAAQLGVRSPYVFAGNTDGDLFCIRESEGAVLWKFPTGSPIRQAPVAERDIVYVMPHDAGIYCVSAADGHEEWVNSSPRKFLAASPTKVYTLDRWNRMLVLDGKSGGTLDTIPLPTDVRPLMNPQTDRILLSSDSGMLQCLHETLLTEPVYYPTPKVGVPPKPKAPAVSHPKPAADDADNPKPAPKPKPKKADAGEAPAPKVPPAKKGKAANQ